MSTSMRVQLSENIPKKPESGGGLQNDESPSVFSQAALGLALYVFGRYCWRLFPETRRHLPLIRRQSRADGLSRMQ